MNKTNTIKVVLVVFLLILLSQIQIQSSSERTLIPSIYEQILSNTIVYAYGVDEEESPSSSSSSGSGGSLGIWKKKVVEPVENITNNETIELLIPEEIQKDNWFISLIKRIWDWIIFWK